MPPQPPQHPRALSCGLPCGSSEKLAGSWLHLHVSSAPRCSKQVTSSCNRWLAFPFTRANQHLAADAHCIPWLPPPRIFYLDPMLNQLLANNLQVNNNNF